MLPFAHEEASTRLVEAAKAADWPDENRVQEDNRDMETEALERPADLTIWRTLPASSPLAQPARFDTLREALAAAAGALTDPAKQPWIITEEGEILSPNWIRTYLN
jgi:hypothetical protein